MEVSYDIYKQAEERRLVWIDRVKGLEQAHERVSSLAASQPGSYLIYDFRQRMVIRPVLKLELSMAMLQPALELQPAAR